MPPFSILESINSHEDTGRSDGGGSSRRDGGGKLLIDIAKASVGEDRDDISGVQLWSDRFDDSIGICKECRRRSAQIQSGDDMLWMQPLRRWNALGFKDPGQH